MHPQRRDARRVVVTTGIRKVSVETGFASCCFVELASDNKPEAGEQRKFNAAGRRIGFAPLHFVGRSFEIADKARREKAAAKSVSTGLGLKPSDEVAADRKDSGMNDMNVGTSVHDVSRVHERPPVGLYDPISGIYGWALGRAQREILRSAMRRLNQDRR